MNEIGFWEEDAAGLPCFEYTGKLPYIAPVDKGQHIKLPDDPWFLLGNYRLTLFSHVSGRYELISGELYDAAPSPNTIHQDISPDVEEGEEITCVYAVMDGDVHKITKYLKTLS